ncbi:hypothetical protein ABEF93_008077 [Exophiala dermatitidis]
MSVPGVLPPSPPSTSSRRKPCLPKDPDNSRSPASFPGSSGTRTRKRVEFSPWTNTHQPSSASQPPSSILRRKSIVPSSECHPSLKSILKPAVVEDKMPQPVSEEQDGQRSVGEMMESITQQLAQDDRSISVDAYQTLAAVIREYDEVPEEATLKNKLNTILKYIKRDLMRQVKPDEPQIADTNVMTQALKVLVIFVWKQDYAALLSDEYRTFILDRSIQVISEHTAPKSVIIHYLHLLATQDFRPGLVTTNNRVGRLLEALKSLTDHVRGNGAISERLLVYQKLLDQARPIMKTKACLWVEEMLTAMTSSMKDIRTKAMLLGVKSCSAFPASSSISSAVRSVLGRELEANKTFNLAMCRRLEKMVASKEEAPQVPQIWAVVLLLSNGPEARIENWVELKDWLKVIQKCFNSSDSAVRQQANMAWNRFIYVVRPHEASDPLMAMLAKPLIAQLERQGTDKTVKSSRSTAVSSYCNLLYYAFRPAASHKQYSRVWNEYVVKVMKSSLFEKNSANTDLACRIFIALLWNANKSTKVWKENRALENTPIEPEELPTIDCKWIRSRSNAIIDMFRVLLRYSSWGASGESDRAYIAIAWSHFLKAIGESCSKEVKPSLDTKNAVTSVLNFLAQLWNDSGVDNVESGQSLSSPQTRQLTRLAVHELDHMLILTSIESGSVSFCKTPVLREVFDAILSSWKQVQENGEMRSHLQPARNTVQTRLSQYQKCLELLNSVIIQDWQSDAQSGAGNSLHVLHIVAEGIRTLDHVLQHAPAHLLTESLTLLNMAMTMLLKDEAGIFYYWEEIAPGKPYQRFINTTVKTLAKVPPESVQPLDSLFTALVESPHIHMVKDTVKGLIYRVNQYEQRPAASRLCEVLRKLHNLAEDEVLAHEQITDRPPKIADTPGLVVEHSTAPDSGKRLAVKPQDADEESDVSPAQGGQGSQHMENEVAEDVNSSPERPVSRSRSRHDDSQVQFVAIASSPPSRDEPESQFLTAHQKEVRERQRSEPAVVFPDLRSSPRHHSKSQSQSDCEFARKAASLVERPSTPTLPTNHDQGEPEIVASPTPRARHSTKQITDIEVPSSPPSILDNRGKDDGRLEITSSPPQRPTEDAGNEIDLAILQADAQSTTAVAEEPTAEKMEEVLPAKLVAPVMENDGMQAGNDGHCDDITEQINAPSDTPEADFAPSTVQETMTCNEMASDDQQAETGEPKVDSDEIDILIASQLSQDLDRHLSQTVEETAGPDSDELMDIQPLEERDEPQSCKRSTRSSRKRKANNYVSSSSKRRKSRFSSQRSSVSLESDVSSVMGSQISEMLDTIEVIAPEMIEPVTVRDFAPETGAAPKEPDQPPKRRRGRPRKYPRNSQSREQSHSQSQSESTSEVNVLVDTTNSGEVPAKEEKNIEQTFAEATLDEPQNVVGEEQDDKGEQAPIPEHEDVTDVEPSAEAAVDTSSREDVDKGEAGSGVISSLQAILERLKSTPKEEIDLRAVDDLCFQIRFQAQVVAQGQP